MLAATHTSLSPATVESGRVIEVDVENYALAVTTEYTQRPQYGISFCTPYQHFSNGEGIYFMPEVGSLCWLAFPSDGSRPFVLGWKPAQDESGNFRARKRALNPGDIFLGTRDENFLILRRGGVVQIGGGPLSQRIYMPVTNAINDFCERYGLHTLGGDLVWSVDRQETTTDGHRPANLSISAREFADDPEPIAVLQIGSHWDNPQNILSLSIKASGEPRALTKISLALTKDGSATWTLDSDLNITTSGNLTSSHGGSVLLTSGKDMTLDPGAKFYLGAGASQHMVAGDTLCDALEALTIIFTPGEITQATVTALKAWVQLYIKPLAGPTPVLASDKFLKP